MQVQLRSAKALTWSATSTTVGSCLLVAILAQGSAAATTLTIQDGTAIKFAPVFAITAPYVVPVAGGVPVGFANLNTVITGTGSYSLIYYPVP